MPLRSVEAATREDAIAAAREQFGPQARVVGVRRVRSGGVLGFFATERYVAEVAPEPFGRSGTPAPAPSAAGPSSALSSPLASAAPATASPSSARPRATAPARNGAAAWAAESARSPDPTPRPAEPAPQAPTSRPAEPFSAPAADEDRLSELAGLLSGEPAEAAPAPYTRATFPRATFPHGLTLLDEDDDVPAPAAAPAPAAPSPFAAALARVVAGDRDVRQAVEDALERPAARAREDAGTWPVWPGSLSSTDTSGAPEAAPQEEETVGDQVDAPSSFTAAQPVDVPTWAVEPEIEVDAVSVSSREEAIAEVLRSALAEGHSDEALAGILRKVLAGDAPAAGSASPFDVAEDVAAQEFASVVAAAVTDSPVPAAEPFAVPLPGPLTAVTVVDQVTDPAPGTSGADIWGAAPAAEVRPSVELTQTPQSHVPLWGETVSTMSAPVARTDAPIWAEIVLHEPAAARPPADSRVATTDTAEPHTPVTPAVDPAASDVALSETAFSETAFSETAFSEPVPEVEIAHGPADAVAEGLGAAEAADPVEADAPAVAEPAVAEVAAPATETVEDVVLAEQSEVARASTGVLEMAPLLARTASDPAPMMSLDATTVMPPLSLLPPLPGSRGRGRPPVPPVSSRRQSSKGAPSEPGAARTPSDREDAAEAAPPAPGVAEVAADEFSVAEPTAAEIPAAATTAAATTAGATAGAAAAGATAGAAADRSAAADATVPAPVGKPLATVTRLPVAPLMATPDTPAMHELADEDDLFAALHDAEAAPATAEKAPTVAPTTVTPTRTPGEILARLEALGLPRDLLGPGFTEDVTRHGTYAALTRALGLRLPKAPELPTGAGEVLFVVGPGVETLRAARALAASLRLDPERVQWATRGDLAGLAPEASRMTTIDAALDRRQAASAAGTVTIVAVDAPMRTDAYWMAQMLAIWSPVAVWAVVEATRKPEDVEPWLDALTRVDALIVQDTDLSADPAAVLRRVDTPVALLDGVRATPHRWASLFCERLEAPQA